MLIALRVLGFCWAMWICVAHLAAAETLEETLRREGVASLATAARQTGDAVRGAIVFYQPQLACTRCHLTDQANHRLGPDLTKFVSEVSDEYLVEAILDPSQVIRKGFETVSVVTNGGQQHSGIVEADDEQRLVLRDAGQNLKRVELAKRNIEEVNPSKVSLMPPGQVNLLTSRQQFLDLVRYLIEIRDGGARRAHQLEPAPFLYAARPLPEYEKHIDHAGILNSLDEEALKRGQQIYDRLCVNCHGTHDRPGSLPTSLKFSTGKFKNGSDPHAMYRTLTHGFGMMAPQTWMVPTQKYDVIHYVREAYLKRHNPEQYFAVDQAYLDRLPQGNTRGPAPAEIQPWEQMDYGPNLVMTLEIGNNASNFAYKGNALRLDAGPGGVAKGRYWMIFDYDTLRVAAAWSGEGFIDWKGINFDGQHNIHPRLVGAVQAANPTGPGWGRPTDGSFEDVRLVGRDGRRYGPLPRDWAHYKGMYYHGAKTIVRYTVGSTDVLEMPGVLLSTPQPVYTRTLNIGPRAHDLIMQVAHVDGAGNQLIPLENAVAFGDRVVAGTLGDDAGVTWQNDGPDLRLKIPRGDKPLRLTVWFARADRPEQAEQLVNAVVVDRPDQDLAPFLQGGPPRWPDVLTSEVQIGKDDGPFAIDVLTLPVKNPWFCRLRLSGFDFTPDGKSAVVSAWDGSIWLVSGLDQLPDSSSGAGARTVPLTWRRIASGLFQPLGVKILGGKIFVTCRDQLCILHDLNGDQEIDYIENFNNDHQVTDHFHEFAMGLQADDEGNFYYAKSARHALKAVVPHHGTLLRVSKDGSRTDILATGFRAANGVCLNADGTYIVTDQEGHWNPKNRINYVREGGFYGNMFGYHDVTDSSDKAMEQPLCWITNAFDRSPGELLWVDSKKWGPLEGQLLNLSYGYGTVFVVPHEKIDGQAQGGMCALPIPRFPTGVMRGRFHPVDGQLYLCGMFAWAGSQTSPGGFYRLRYTGQPVHMPVDLRATEQGMALKFSGPLDPPSASDAKNYQVTAWDLKRTARYGSDHYNQRPLRVTAARLDDDGKTVRLDIPDIQPTWGMEIRYRIQSSAGKTVTGTIHNTIHKLGESSD